MTDATSAARWRAGRLAAVLIAGGSGYWLGQSGQSDAPSEAAGSGTGVARTHNCYHDPVQQRHVTLRDQHRRRADGGPRQRWTRMSWRRALERA